MTGRYDRAALLAATDLAELADALLGTRSGPTRSPTWPCPNPQHAQTGKTPPVTIFTSHRGEQRWRCHGCGTGGTAIDLLMATRHTDIAGALELLATRAPILASTIDRESSRPAPVPRAYPDPEGLASYVTDCAARLWRPEGSATRRWLEVDRGLDQTVLGANKIGADPGPRRQGRPDGMPRGSGVVLPVIDSAGVPTYAQLRSISSSTRQPRYLNPTGALAPNPRFSHLRPAQPGPCEILVTEGAIDALTAASAGYRAVAVLGAGYPDEAIAAHLARLRGPLVLAFDPDPAGDLGNSRLLGLLHAHRRPALVLRSGAGDLNEQRLASANWPADLRQRIAAVRIPSRQPHGIGAA